MALELCNLCVIVDDGFWQAYVQLGRLYTQDGDFGQAVEAYQEVLRLQPGHAEAARAVPLLRSELQKQKDK